MARSQTLVQLTDELVDALDGVADRRSVSRSALIREALEEFLARDRARFVDERIVAGYRAIPPGEPDGWGDVESVADLATAELMVRLEHEEGDRGW